MVVAPKRNSLIDGQAIRIAFPFTGLRNELVYYEVLAVLGDVQSYRYARSCPSRSRARRHDRRVYLALQ